VQHQLLSNQELDAINKNLLTAGDSIEVSRQKLFETRFVASSALQDLEQERQVRQRCSDAYKELHVQYGRNVAEMHEMTTKCVSLHKELEESQKTLSHYESSFEEFKRRAAENEDRIGDLERRRVETAKQIEVVIDRDNSARKRIDELEKERGDLIQGHRAAISVRMARECLAEQRIDELQEGVDALIREHQAAMNIAIDRMNSAEQKVGEFRKIISTSEHQEVASTCLTPSPEQSLGALKRPSSETKQQGGRPSKHRKCKDATTMGEEGTIVVRT
jgi:DNA repair exonuclease SbcCD ATPase subunit